ncbi:MAG: diaminopimelate decarboxylase [Bacteroidetes bacterium]|nr:diaminopimelate decarboxylase [Bacteroidota bacterium]
MFDKEIVQKFGSRTTPFYYYDLEVLKRTLDKLSAESKKYGFVVHYALKANTNDRVLSTIRKYALGADCVSGNEVKKAIEIGFPVSDIVFAGVGKSDAEINFSLDNDIFCFNCESVQELEVINELALKKKKTARIALRINPNVNANTHHYITTGLEENKFGINMWELDHVLKTLKGLSNVKFVGIHFHIGSQITDLSTFKNLCTRVNEIQKWFENHHLDIEHINVGGGLGVNYHEPDVQAIPDFENYFKIFNEFLERKPAQKVHFELGRAVVAQCCSLISGVLYIKKGVATNFAILDAGMTELIRPALYQSYHKIENISSLVSRPSSLFLKYDVVGPICESSDCFGKAVELPETKRGDLIALRTAGAYGEAMASNYNLREKAPSVYSDSI